MSYRFSYAAVREHPRKVIHVVRVFGELLEPAAIEELAARMRERVLMKHGEPEAAVVVVQGGSKETLHLYGEPYAVTRVRAAMFNAAIRWQDFALD